jgi:SAM-dependent methyltransferase
MEFSFEAFLYQLLIDPILSNLHKSILSIIKSSDKVLDVACGTGSLSLAIAAKAFYVKGIDLSEPMIKTAMKSAGRRGVKNAEFTIHDASDLTDFKDHEFEIAVTSMAIHQFEAELAIRILSEMKRIASKIIVIDYNYPLPKGFSGTVAAGIERLAGGDHYRNFSIYMKSGGIEYFTSRSGLEIKSQVLKGKGVFAISVCSSV